MKKLFKFGMVMLLAISLVGCGGDNDSKDKKDDLLSGNHHAVIDVKDYGVIKVELNADEAPITVTNFVKLAKDGFYDGLTFLKEMVQEDLMKQSKVNSVQMVLIMF